MKAFALSIGREAWASDVVADDVPMSGGRIVGTRVPWGACFEMGVNVEEAMKASRLHGVKNVPFSSEVCTKVYEYFGLCWNFRKHCALLHCILTSQTRSSITYSTPGVVSLASRG